MVGISEPSTFKDKATKVKADVIILGCTLPGIVAAHKLKKRFGDSMDIVVLDLAAPKPDQSKYNVTFQRRDSEKSDNDGTGNDTSASHKLVDNVARYYLATYAREFNLPLPDDIMNPEKGKEKRNKLFQHVNGRTVQCSMDFNDFEYLSFVEKFEMNQYLALLDQNIKNLFQTNIADTVDRSRLMFYDRTTMEKHICGALIFTNSREIMRMTVRLVCGAPADTVSVLFYLHQCYRTSGSRNHLDGYNTRLREKLLGYFKKRLASSLQQSIADITFESKPIKQIRTCSDDQVVLETIKGGTTYVCNLLALALKPDELYKINVEGQLLSNENLDVMNRMMPGRAKKFFVQYEESFWEKQGYSGDILSVRGPIIWAMERPKMSNTGSINRYPALIGYLMTDDEDDNVNSRKRVLMQLVKLFGEEAATPVIYRETNVVDVFIPKCGDYVALRKLISRRDLPKFVEWGALDVFADGDLAASLEAGHKVYLHLLSCLRPQAQTFEDLSTTEFPTFLTDKPIERWLAHVNIISSMKWSVYVAATIVTISVIRSYFKR